MIEGVAVEKDRGREVFEKIVRQGIDPGLVEWTKGNNFKTRVFPIPARGSRTIRLGYVTELTGGGEQPASYHLPLDFRDRVGRLSLRVEVVKTEASPKVVRGGPKDFTFGKWRDSFVAEATLEGDSLADDLVVALPNVKQRNVWVEKAADGRCYFALTDFPAVPEQSAVGAEPKHVVILWDASGSRASGDRQREIGLLRQYFSLLRESQKASPIQVDLVLVRNEPGGPKRFVYPSDEFDRLFSELESVDYDGGSQLGAIRSIAGGERPDFYLLFSDGISTFGRDTIHGLDAPVYCFSADAATDHAALAHLAAKTGGRYFNLKRLDDTRVIDAIGRSSYCFLEAKADEMAAGEMVPSMPEPLAGRFTLVGVLSGDEADVTLSYGHPGNPAKQASWHVSRSDAVEGSLLRRFWAQKRLAELLVNQRRNEPQIVELGKTYGLVTPFTSLIVLDSLEQYVEHEIMPPESLAEMREEYLRRIDTLEHQQRKQKADKLEAVLAMWQERVQWWQQEFQVPKNFKYKGEQEQGGRAFGALGGEAAPTSDAPMAEPPASPAPSPADPQEAPAAEDMFEDSAPAGGANRDMEGEASQDEASKSDEDAGRRAPGISVKEWDPKTPYLEELRAAKPQAAWEVYMKNRDEFGDSPAFFLDCSDYFAGADQHELALRVLSNIAEMELENPAVLRVLGHRLAQTARFDLAILTFEEVLRLRPEEPQSYRDLALVVARRAQSRLELAAKLEARAGQKGSAPVTGEIKALQDRAEDLRARAQAEYRRSLNLLARVVMGEWDGRFEAIELIALTELNAILPAAQAAGVEAVPLDKRLVKLLDHDVRIVMTWHADNTDMDIWVIEPSSEKAYYGHNQTTIGGRVSNDFTGGYGPEEYTVRRAMPGVYKIQANYYGSSAVKLLGAVTVQVDVFTDHGRKTEQHKSLTVRLKEAEETVDIGEIEF